MSEMTKEELSNRFEKATELAREFAKQCVINEIPLEKLYVIRENLDEEGIKSEPYGFAHVEGLSGTKVVDLSAIINYLFRPERVPQWINICLLDIEKTALYKITYGFDIYSDEEALDAFSGPEIAPFQIRRPSSPDDDQDKKFDLHWWKK